MNEKALLEMKGQGITGGDEIAAQGKEVKKLEDQEKGLQAEVNVERERLGLDGKLLEEAADELRFKGQFQKLAVRVGKEMLQDNLHKVALIDPY